MGTCRVELVCHQQGPCARGVRWDEGGIDWTVGTHGAPVGPAACRAAGSTPGVCCRWSCASAALVMASPPRRTCSRESSRASLEKAGLSHRNMRMVVQHTARVTRVSGVLLASHSSSHDPSCLPTICPMRPQRSRPRRHNRNHAQMDTHVYTETRTDVHHRHHHPPPRIRTHGACADS